MARGYLVRTLLICTAAVSLAACAGGPSSSRGAGRFANVPYGHGIYKVGSPYQVDGVWYYPAVNYDYDQTGIASWYGPGFHEELTANGEIFDQNKLSAASKTLPMPSLVRVTDLENGRSIVLRVNDRGPFVNGRIIDVSRRAAQLLGFEGQGTAKVRVQILADESRALAAAMQSGEGGTQVASAGEEAGGPPPKAAPLTPVVSQQTLAPPSGRPAQQALRPSPQPVRTAMAAPPVVDPATGKVAANPDFSPAPVVQTVPVGGPRQIYVQAGAFSNLENANRLKGRLSSIGPTAISRTTVNGTDFYRVRLGPIPDVAHADTVLNKVIQAGNNDARVVVD